MPIVGSPSPGITEGPDEDIGGFDLGQLGGGGRPDIGGGPLFNVPDFSVGIFNAPLFIPRINIPQLGPPPIRVTPPGIISPTLGPEEIYGPVRIPPPPDPTPTVIAERPTVVPIFHEPPPPLIPDEATYPTPAPPPPPPTIVGPGIVVQGIPPPFIGPINLVKEDDVSHDLGHILSTIAGQVISEKVGISPPGFVAPPGVVPASSGPATDDVIAALVGPAGGGACYPPANTKGMIYSPRARCGQGGWIKQRRRRRRLASASDVKDISALNSVLPKGMLKIWIATHS